jgi:hypothetical protein
MNKNRDINIATVPNLQWLLPMTALLLAQLCVSNAAFALRAIEDCHKGKARPAYFGFR